MTRIWASLIGCTSLVFATGVAAEQGKGHKPDQTKQEQPKGGGKADAAGAKKAKHQHHDKNGRALLGAKLKQDGKHAVGKFKDRDVTAEVKGGKVVAMRAGDLEPKRVRTKTKMAYESNGVILAAWTGGPVQLAQYEPYYYGYCFDDGVDFDCYWYPAEDVDYEAYAWEDYDPYY